MTGRVTRTVPYAKRYVPKMNFIAVGEPAVRRAVLGIGKTGAPGVPAKRFKKECIVRVRTLDRNTEVARKFSCAACVIEVAMREKDLLEIHAERGDCGFQAIDFAARIDHGAAHRPRAPDEGTILLIGRDGKDLRLQGWMAHYSFRDWTEGPRRSIAPVSHQKLRDLTDEMLMERTVGLHFSRLCVLADTGKPRAFLSWKG